MTTKDLIRYDLLVQDALKGVVRKVLGDVARDGLHGEHHFYVSFRTDFPGVRLSTRMREKYPQEMTIVLQHQFWDLGVSETFFEVGLSFSGVPERLLVPFDALTGFFDPSVQFGLKFEVQSAEEEGAPVSEPPKQPARGAASEPAELPGRKLSGPSPTPAPKPTSTPKPQPAAKSAPSDAEKAPDAAKRTEGEAAEGASGEPAGGAEVVSLDAFRKKT